MGSGEGARVRLTGRSGKWGRGKGEVDRAQWAVGGQASEMRSRAELWGGGQAVFLPTIFLCKKDNYFL